MARDTIEATIDTKNASSINEALAQRVLDALYAVGVQEFCVCPGSRNHNLVTALLSNPDIKTHYWFEERSAAFFALGRSRLTEQPVAVVVTSGTATAELFPAVMTAYYKNVPLILITADRPRRFRGVGAPQSAEQLNLFGLYTPLCIDLESEENCCLENWDGKYPLHLNVCFEDRLTTNVNSQDNEKKSCSLSEFFQQSHSPFVIVGALRKGVRENVINFLLDLGAPIYLEGLSGLREEPRLQCLRITNSDKIFENSQATGYLIDGILRIGEIPTFRFWRDVEELGPSIPVCNLSELPFSGMSWADVNCGPLDGLLSVRPCAVTTDFTAWLKMDQDHQNNLLKQYKRAPRAEASLVHDLSKLIPTGSHVYLGNSLPIREWDVAATSDYKAFHVTASRGINGIDGQISTFLGLCQPGVANWAILGDLTTLYDLAGPWILPQLADMDITIVVINNGGGKIFEKMFKQPEFLNSHNLSFKPFAEMWGLSYERWEQIPARVSGNSPRLIEIIPDCQAIL